METIDQRGATFIFTYYEIRFGIIWFSSVNDTEALVFGFYLLLSTTGLLGALKLVKAISFAYFSICNA